MFASIFTARQASYDKKALFSGNYGGMQQFVTDLDDVVLGLTTAGNIPWKYDPLLSKYQWNPTVHKLFSYIENYPGQTDITLPNLGLNPQWTKIYYAVGTDDYKSGFGTVYGNGVISLDEVYLPSTSFDVVYHVGSSSLSSTAVYTGTFKYFLGVEDNYIPRQSEVFTQILRVKNPAQPTTDELSSQPV